MIFGKSANSEYIQSEYIKSPIRKGKSGKL